jgi:Activator of Hsp90 ATPase homolog 1-like protein
MTLTDSALDNLTLNITHEIQVRASLAATFDSVLEQMGPANETPDGKPLPMILEARPGGRWFRDLGDGNGHFWGHVQAIKRPTLLEITGPLMMSAPVMSNLQYRLREVDGGTLIVFRHSALGFVPDDYREGLSKGWTPLLDRIRKQAESVGHGR